MSLSAVSPWGAVIESRRTELEAIAGRAAGTTVALHCHAEALRMEVELVAPFDEERLDALLDSLAPLWPGFLAPLSVTLAVPGFGEWDGEAMAMREGARS